MLLYYTCNKLIKYSKYTKSNLKTTSIIFFTNNIKFNNLL